MANDRLFLKCVCGDYALLAKYWGAGAFAMRSDTLPPLDAWMTAHAQDCFRQWAGTLEDSPLFELRTEATATQPHTNASPDVPPRSSWAKDDVGGVPSPKAAE